MVHERGWMVAAACTLALGATAQTVPARAPVVVELFTSEGCSSCPAADEALDALWRAQPIDGVEVIPLSFHVDYWNSLGWQDPFSSSTHTERQSDYDRALGQGLFTPQIVVNGQASMVGSAPGLIEKIRSVHQKETATPIELSVRGGSSVSVAVKVTPPPGAPDDALELWAAIIESGIQSEVRAGENAGRTLRLAPVVRRFERMGAVTAASHSAQLNLALQPTWHRENLRAVVVLQDRKSRKVWGAATTKVDSAPR